MTSFLFEIKGATQPGHEAVIVVGIVSIVVVVIVAVVMRVLIVVIVIFVVIILSLFRLSLCKLCILAEIIPERQRNWVNNSEVHHRKTDQCCD